MKVLGQAGGKDWELYHGDACEVARGIPDNSTHFTIYSPPFESLYTYSNSERDMGNCSDSETFWGQYQFLIAEQFRMTMPGRIVAVHCMNLPAMKERDGYIGIKNFRDDIIRAHQAAGFIWHSEHVIWKDPLIEATRTKALGLMHKQLCKDSAMCRAGMPDYLEAFRKPGDNPERVTHPNGLETFAGENAPTKGNRSHEYWRRYASPVWMDIDQTKTLQTAGAREASDERHICPLQLDVIERGIQLWSNPRDIVFSPFTGIGSEGYQALTMGRRFVGIELKESYYRQAVKNLRSIESQRQIGLFDGTEAKELATV